MLSPMLRISSVRAVFLRYCVAVLTVSLTAILWYTVVHQFEPDPYPLFLVAVTVSAFYGGLGPGLVTSVLSAAAGFYLYHHGTQLDLFLVLAAFLTWLMAPLRRYQEQLRQQVDFTKAITNNLGEGVCVIDRRERITYTNPATEKILGWSRSELRNERAAKFLRSPNQDVGSPREVPLLDALREGARASSDESLFVRNDGKTVAVSYTASPILRGKDVVGGVIAFRDVSSRNLVLDALEESEERYKSLVETSPDGIILCDMYTFIIMANQRAAEMHGYRDADELCGMSVGDLVAPEDRQRATEDRQKAPLGKVVRNVEYSLLRKDGRLFPGEVSVSVLRGENGEPRGLASFISDITDRKQDERTLRANEGRLSMQYAATKVLADAATVDEAIWKTLQTVCESGAWDVGIFWTLDRRQNALRCRDVWHAPWVSIPEFAYLSRQLTFAPGEPGVGTVWSSGEPAWVADVVADPTFSRALMASKENLHGAFCLAVKGASQTHGVMEFLSSEIRQRDENVEDAITTIGTQIGQFIDRKDAEEALEHQALHDALTDLPNRSLLMDRLDQAIRSAHRGQGQLALLLMDLDRFKEVNDTLGHHYGDLLLQEAAIRLRHTLRGSDTVARLGGDEFAILLPGTDGKGAGLAAGKLLKALGQPFVTEGQSFDVGASVGIALYPSHGADAGTLLRRADVAMYMAKHGSSGYAFYDEELDEYSSNRLALMGDLREAIEDGQMVVHYQPKVDIKTGQLVSAEALVRWQHPEHGILPPEQFIHLAEHVGLIQILSLQVLSTALRQCRAWHDQGINTRVAVNLSPSTLRDPQLVGMIAGMIRTCEAQPGWLEVEIAESAVMADSEQATEVLDRLRQLGVRVSLDDFGNGYSSLAHLQRLPVDEVKLDKSFVLDLAAKSENLHIVRSVIDLSRNLRLSVVAEGVATEEVWNVLADLGCDMAQGTYVSAPLSAGELVEKFGGAEPRLSGVS